jgi:hypothetical protein
MSRGSLLDIGIEARAAERVLLPPPFTRGVVIGSEEIAG